jgi:chromosome partitioning protein
MRRAYPADTGEREPHSHTEEGRAVPIVTALNQKGGVGKTSTCYHLAGTLAQLGRKVLLVDADPQSSLTQGFLGPQQTRRLEVAETIAAVLAGEAVAGRAVRGSGLAGVDLVPGSRLAASANIPDPHLADWPAQVALREFLGEVSDGYDLVLIDCPPNLHLCSWAALVAADALVVPVMPEDFGAQGLADVQESVARVVAGPNPGLALAGYLITMISARRTVHQIYEERLRVTYGDDVFATRVPESVDFVEAIAQRKPVAQYKPRGVAAKAIKALAEELDARVAARLAAREGRGAA